MTGVAALAISAAFTSCSKNEELYNPEVVKGNEATTIVEKYNQAFTKYVGGTISPDQTWGFGGYSAGTRADSEYANGNMWAAKDDGHYLVPDPLSEGQKARVQYFYQKNNVKTANKSYGNIDFFMQQVYTGGTDPTGVSPEKYRSVDNKIKQVNQPDIAPDLEGGKHMDHLIAGTAKAHINNFNGGDCGTYPNILNNDPQVLKDYPNATEGGYVANQNSQYNHSDKIELMLSTNTDYFGYANSDDSDVRIDRYWQVSAETIDAYIAANKSDYDTWLAAKSQRVGHTIEDAIVNDFWGQLGRGFIGFDYDMLISGECFATKSWDGDNVNLRLIDGEKEGNVTKAWTGEKLVDISYAELAADFKYDNKSVRYLRAEKNFYCGEVATLTLSDIYYEYTYKDNNGADQKAYAINLKTINDKLRDGYLPVKGRKFEEWVKIGGCNDGYYSDWIVTFMPALKYTIKTGDDPDPDPDSSDVCIIAEDLSASGDTDFDFNDVVFTVHYTSTTTATVTLYAAGGTLPLTVADEEVHAKFGYAQPDSKTGLYKMINTGAKADVNDVATVSFSVASQKSTRGKDITIKVNKGEKDENGKIISDNWIELTATGGAPAAKLCVGADFATGKKWCAERESIKSKYPRFSTWVANSPTLVWWK